MVQLHWQQHSRTAAALAAAAGDNQSVAAEKPRSERCSSELRLVVTTSSLAPRGPPSKARARASECDLAARFALLLRALRSTIILAQWSMMPTSH